MAHIEAKGIAKTFYTGDIAHTVLSDASFTIDEGELLAITGPSGSGKSTLMNIIGCLDRPTEGQYLIDGYDVAHLSSDELAHIRNAKIGFVFQKFNLLPDLTALDNVALPQLYDSASEEQARKAAEEMLTLVDLADKLHHYPYQLSGGQQQRVAIARALVNNPAIILADEPTGNLDSKTGELIMNIFMKLNSEQKKTIIIVTHDAGLAQKTNRIIKLLDGKIVSDSHQQNP
jgi:putative ABC transport system ATP-binding protein